MIDQPDWDLLPGQAEEFFGLEHPYTRSDLKRSYNRILRRYKPEQFPDEFKLLRAAFEKLEEMLRYGSQSMSPNVAPLATEHAADRGDEGTLVERASLSDRFENLGAEGLQAELEAQDARTPDEWIALAALREVASGAEPLVFHETLMDGIIASYGDDLVVNTLVGSLRDPISVRDAGKLVQVMARWIQEKSPQAANWYYFASAPLWIFLVSKVPFDKYKSLLDRCRERVGIDGHGGYLTLILRLLRKGALMADSEWIRTAMQDLYESYESLSHDLCDEIDVLEYLHAYMEHRDQFLDEHPARAVWDEALVAILSEEETDADRAFLTATSEALDDPETLLDAFQPSAEHVGYAITPLFAFSDEAFARMEEPEQIRDPATLGRLILPFMFRLEKLSERGLTGKVDEVVGYAAFFLVLASLFLPGLLLGSFLSAGCVSVVTLVCAALSVFASSRIAAWLYNKNTGPMYRKIWRNQVREFLQANPMHMHELIDCIENIKEKGITNQHRLVAQLHSDPGMVLYSLSLRFAQ